MNLFSLVAIPVVLAAVARPARVERGNTGQCVLDPIDTAAWICHPACTNDAPAAPAFLDEIAALEREGWIRVTDVPR